MDSDKSQSPQYDGCYREKAITIGEYVPLTEGRQILLDKGQGGRLVIVQLVNN